MKGLITKFKRKLKFRSRKRKKKARFSLFSVRKGGGKGKGMRQRMKNISLTFLIICLALLIFIWIIACIHKLITADLKRGYKDDAVKTEWRGGGRMNVLLVGMDRREGEFGYIDALLVVMIDPQDRKVGIFNLNVDTTVNMGAGQEYRLRGLYNQGILNSKQAPIQFVAKGVETLLSLEINRYILLDEEGLIDLANSLGGIYVDNKSAIEDADIGKDRGNFSLPEGSFRLGGEDFLNYLRSDDDGQANKLVRQLDGTKGLLKRIASYNVFIRFLKLVDVFEDKVYTDLAKPELIRIGYELMRAQEINSAFMGKSSLQEQTSGEEVVYYPVFDVLDEDIQAVFGDPSISKEQARVEIFNSTNIFGLGAFRARWLRNIGVDVIRVGDTSKHYEKTTVYTGEKKKYVNTINAIKKSFKENVEFVEGMPDFICTGDVIIVLGANVET